MKVAPLITVALFLCIAFPGPIQAKKKFCMGKNGNKYAVGNGYDDKEGEVCIRYKCVKKKKKVIMKEMKCNLSCTSTQSTLSSNGFKYHKTKLKNDITKMEVVQKISKSSCIQSFSFGFKGPEAWVDKGCRAKFRFSFCKSEIGTTLQPVTCPPVPTCPTVTTCPDKTCPSIPSCPTFSPKTTCPPNPTFPATPTCPTVPEQTTCPEKSCPPSPTSPTSPTNGAIPTTTAITSDSCEESLCISTDGCSLVKNSSLTTLPQLNKEFFISFEFQATEYIPGWQQNTAAGWQNVIHFTEGEVGQRVPGFWVWNSGQLHLSFAINGHGNYNIITEKQYSLNEWHSVEFSQSLKNGKYIYRAVIDGEDITGPLENKDPKTFSNVKVYAADPWHNSLKGSIRNLLINTDSSNGCEAKTANAIDNNAINNNAIGGVLV